MKGRYIVRGVSIVLECIYFFVIYEYVFYSGKQ